jgi:hypothetical protein
MSMAGWKLPVTTLVASDRSGARDGVISRGEDATETQAEFSWPLGDIVTALAKARLRIVSRPNFPVMPSGDWAIKGRNCAVCPAPCCWLGNGIKCEKSYQTEPISPLRFCVPSIGISSSGN